MIEVVRDVKERKLDKNASKARQVQKPNSYLIEDIFQIVDLQIDELRNRLQDKKIDIEVSNEAKIILAEKGYDPVYGARPLKRTIQKEVQNPFALKILEGQYKKGDTLHIDLNGKKEFVFSKIKVSGEKQN